jgi:MFS family permease
MSSDQRTDHAEAPTSILHARYRLITIGMFALIALTAFENLAVTTVMPTISRELHGSALYALAFAGPLAIGVIGRVSSGNLSDR